MIKGLGHLIRIVFGGRQPAPALPSHTTGGVGDEGAVPPLASDDVLRRAMEAAGEAEPEARVPPGSEPRYQTPQIEEISSLPMLFLHGKPSGPGLHDPSMEITEFTEVVPSLQVAEGPERVPPAEADPVGIVAHPREVLRAGMAYEEIEYAPRASDLILFGREFATHAERVQQVAAPPPVTQVRVIGQEMKSPAEDAVAEQSLTDLPSAGAVHADDEPHQPSRRRAEPGTRRRKAAKSLPEDAVWLTDAVIWTQCGSWREFWLPPTDPKSSVRVEEFRQLAAEGQLTVWGRTGEALEWAPIAASHWKKAGFDPLAFLAGRENAFSQAPVKKSRTKPPADPVRYSSLMVSKGAVEAIWSARTSSDAAVA